MYLPDIFKVESEGESEEEGGKIIKVASKKKKEESEEETKEKGLFSTDEEEQSSGAEEAKGSESDSPNRSCKCIKCGKETTQNLKTKIKDGKEFKTVCFCSFKCFEKFKK